MACSASVAVTSKVKIESMVAELQLNTKAMAYVKVWAPRSHIDTEITFSLRVPCHFSPMHSEGFWFHLCSLGLVVVFSSSWKCFDAFFQLKTFPRFGFVCCILFWSRRAIHNMPQLLSAPIRLFPKENAGHRNFEVLRELVAAVKESDASRCSKILLLGHSRFNRL